MKIVYVQFDLEKVVKVVRIFKNYSEASEYSFHNPEVVIGPASRKDAVKSIRDQIWDRTEGNCEWCSKPITKEQMHMHEKVSRGRGGNISLENSVGICYQCHFGPIGHGDRAPRFGDAT